MTTRLTDNERTLLSAYRDGELSSTEKAQAEQLLAASPDARQYLGDLRSLNAFSHSAFPAASAIGAGAAFGSKLTSGAIRSAAHSGGRSAISGSWSIAGFAAAAVATVAVLSFALSGNDASVDDVNPSAVDRTPHAAVQRTSIDVDSSWLMIPAITDAELIDFAVTGCLPIDSSRERYVTVRQQSGELAIKMHDAPRASSTTLRSLGLRSVPGLDSLERAIRTSLLQADDKGIAVSMDLPSLRLGVIEALQEATNDLPADVRRSMGATRHELDREYQRLSGELRQSRLDGRRDRSSGGVRYLVVAGTDMPKAAQRDMTYTFGPNDRSVRSFELSTSDLGSLSAQVDVARPPAPRVAEQRARIAAAPTRVSIRRSPMRASGARATTVIPPVIADSTITFEEIQKMQSRGNTLDGVYNVTEPWLERAERILKRAEETRRRIEQLRRDQLQAPQPDSVDADHVIDDH